MPTPKKVAKKNIVQEPHSVIAALGIDAGERKSTKAPKLTGSPLFRPVKDKATVSTHTKKDSSISPRDSSRTKASEDSQSKPRKRVSASKSVPVEEVPAKEIKKKAARNSKKIPADTKNSQTQTRVADEVFIVDDIDEEMVDVVYVNPEEVKSSRYLDDIFGAHEKNSARLAFTEEDENATETADPIEVILVQDEDQEYIPKESSHDVDMGTEEVLPEIRLRGGRKIHMHKPLAEEQIVHTTKRRIGNMTGIARKEQTVDRTTSQEREMTTRDTAPISQREIQNQIEVRDSFRESVGMHSKADTLLARMYGSPVQETDEELTDGGFYSYHREVVLENGDILNSDFELLKKPKKPSLAQIEMDKAKIYEERERLIRKLQEDKQNSLEADRIREIEEREEALRIARYIDEERLRILNSRITKSAKVAAKESRTQVKPKISPQMEELALASRMRNSMHEDAVRVDPYEEIKKEIKKDLVHKPRATENKNREEFTLVHSTPAAVPSQLETSVQTRAASKSSKIETSAPVKASVNSAPDATLAVPQIVYVTPPHMVDPELEEIKAQLRESKHKGHKRQSKRSIVFKFSLVIVALLFMYSTVYFYDAYATLLEVQKTSQRLRTTPGPVAQASAQTAVASTSTAARTTEAASSTPHVLTATETGYLKKIAKYVALPQGEVPKIFQVVDPASARKQALLKSAEKGDVVVMYEQAKTVILYRPSTDKVLSAGPF